MCRESFDQLRIAWLVKRKSLIDNLWLKEDKTCDDHLTSLAFPGLKRKRVPWTIDDQNKKKKTSRESYDQIRFMWFDKKKSLKNNWSLKEDKRSRESFDHFENKNNFLV